MIRSFGILLRKLGLTNLVSRNFKYYTLEHDETNFDAEIICIMDRNR